MELNNQEAKFEADTKLFTMAKQLDCEEIQAGLNGPQNGK